MSDQDNYFARLNAINVSEHIEKKGGFSYLSWPYAVSQLRLADPTATWVVCRFDGKPYLLCEAGVFVEVAVTVQGVTLSQIHPVLDARNRPIPAPTAFDINSSIQRCLVKAIAQEVSAARAMGTGYGATGRAAAGDGRAITFNRSA